MNVNWSTLDEQMRRYSPRLRDDLRIDPVARNHLASSITLECAALPSHVVAEIGRRDVVGIDARLEELTAFQAFMGLAGSVPPHPSIVRAQVINQNYICFVYLGDSCFRVLQKNVPSGSTTWRCCRFLTDNPIRTFRNALAHANWRYNEDFNGLRFWARKGSDPNEPLDVFEVSQLDLDFWQALARCVAYVAFTYAKGRIS
jgi:hypothetical protein